MSSKARAFQAIILVLALAMAVRQGLTWTSSNDPAFLAYLALTVVTSLLRLGVPTAAGTISVGFIFILASIAQLNLGQTLIIGVSGTVIHCMRDQKNRVDWLSLAFQTAVVVLGIEAANAAYQRIYGLLPHGGVAAALPLAGTILFLVTAFPLAATTALSERELLRRVWQNRFLWSLPYYLAGAALAGLLTAVVHLPWWQTAVMILPLLFLVYRSYGLQIDSLSRERLHAEELASLQLSMVEALALAVESKDSSALDHLHRMSTYAVGLGRAVGLRDEQLKALRAAAVLHDIGQVAVPDHIIMKPGRLTPEEYERLKVHPDVGADIIERAHFPYAVAPIVRAHHERWDGSGYPRGLKGGAIPLEARILAAVDTLIALSSDRHYRRALPLDKSMAVVCADAGRGLDPDVVAVLEKTYRKLEEHSRATHSGGKRTFGAQAPDLSALAAAPRDNPALVETPAFLATIAAARREEQSLLEFTQILGSSLNLQETLTALARRFRRQIPYDTMVVFLRRDNRLHASFIEGENYALFNGLSMGLNEGLSGVVAFTRKPALNADPAAEPMSNRDLEAFARLRSALAVPLDGPEGVAGVLTFYSERRDVFAPSHLGLLLAIAPKLALTVGNALRFREAETQATYDFLTGLPNAASLSQHLRNELARAARNNARITILVCDLDGFKQVNDRFGHLAGNKLLQAVGQGLKDLCREYDFVARMGGDEFVMVLPGPTEDALRLRRRRLCAMVENAGMDLCQERTVSLSLGVAHFPDDGLTAENLLAVADSRMYEDKSYRRGLRAGITAGLPPAQVHLDQL
ncbi:MAG: diguanylate cyclase [Candidatus Solibacter usitatus]|nr:diguanylate cyclase [Candidatus Solibacter usitatus]